MAESKDNARQPSPEKDSSLPGDLVTNGKNSKWVECKLCHSKVLRPQTAEYIKEEIFLPSMQQKTKINMDSPEGDTLHHYWLVHDMFAFENVGFSKTVNNVKYLTCADCEVGPIGWQLANDSTRFLVALERVKHS
ncbi:predicted protein [Nematostella vectensis]|uniref:Guanine nucleotide exchange factor MSS4 n=1 Tax=Nematostella vectensis TaxID=45351 RepID=A7SP34_NEMVE|nr:predicted protein [Nematostella vectensis]|eukprot:XP_001626639.1 predicted protein [Nematostella vectensis]